jgi:hypothetical protein
VLRAAEVIEVGQDALGGWAWTMIGDDRRILVYRTDFESQWEAVEDARSYRRRFFAAAAAVDHRQGACI